MPDYTVGGKVPTGSVAVVISSREAFRIGLVFIKAALWGWIRRDASKVSIHTTFEGVRAPDA